jgi:hypothetical protein
MEGGNMQMIYLIDFEATKEMMDRVGQPPELKVARLRTPLWKRVRASTRLRLPRPSLGTFVPRGEQDVKPYPAD